VNQAQEHSITAEFEDVSFGDKRLDRRLGTIARAMELAPGDSLVEQSGNVAALEATYRFLSNPRVSSAAIFDAHAKKTVERASAYDSVLVIHDTTEFRFGGAKERSGLGRINSNKRDGFLAHFSICLSPDGEPLGNLELLAWSRLDRGKRKQSTGSLFDPHRESLRWLEAAERSSERLYGKTKPIHVMDREGDQFELFATLVSNGEHFVVRLGRDRRLKAGRGKDSHPMLNAVLGNAPVRFRRQVQLGRREVNGVPNKHHVFPERDPRIAYLEIRACSINLHRAHQHVEHVPESLELNFVEAREVDAPPGTTPVLWRLVTTASVGTDAEVANVIDIYRQRWVIEEFFKALKTGCHFEDHQLEDIKGLLVALALESTIAWQLLRLRHVARHQPDAPADCLVTPLELKVLARLRTLRGQANKVFTVQDVISELSRLGVHLANNGPPGWAVLKRGLRKLSVLAEGMALALSPCTPEDVINH
jgi:hypothetical protein